MGDLLDAVLRDAQRRGYLGAGDIDAFVRHALGYLAGPPSLGGADSEDARSAIDLGSGSGIPGLVLANELPDTTWHLVERSGARADWLRRAVVRLGMADRVVVRHEPAEAVGRGPLRGMCELVVARLFAAPAVAAECAAPLLIPGGRAIFSDARGALRWDVTQLGELGLAILGTWANAEGSYVALQQQAPCPDRFPRSPGVPARRPLF